MSVSLGRLAQSVGRYLPLIPLGVSVGGGAAPIFQSIISLESAQQFVSQGGFCASSCDYCERRTASLKRREVVPPSFCTKSAFFRGGAHFWAHYFIAPCAAAIQVAQALSTKENSSENVLIKLRLSRIAYASFCVAIAYFYQLHTCVLQAFWLPYFPGH